MALLFFFLFTPSFVRAVQFFSMSAEKCNVWIYKEYGEKASFFTYFSLEVGLKLIVTTCSNKLRGKGFFSTVVPVTECKLW